MKIQLEFHCDSCGARFDACGRLETWTSSLYGPCQEYLADCPSCGKPAKEHRVKSNASSGEGECGQGACERAGSPAVASGGGGCDGCPCG